MKHPSAPRVSTTFRFASSPAVSKAFGVKSHVARRMDSGNGRAGAGLKITFVPCRAASSTARTFTASGTSFVSRRTAAAAIASSNASTSATSSRTPGNTVTRVSPDGSVRIAAYADAPSFTTSRCAIPSPSNTAPIGAASAAPTAARKDVSAPQRAAATAWLKPLPPYSTCSASACTVSPPVWKRGTRRNADVPAKPITHTRLTGSSPFRNNALPTRRSARCRLRRCRSRRPAASRRAPAPSARRRSGSN